MYINFCIYIHIYGTYHRRILGKSWKVGLCGLAFFTYSATITGTDLSSLILILISTDTDLSYFVLTRFNVPLFKFLILLFIITTPLSDF